VSAAPGIPSLPRVVSRYHDTMTSNHEPDEVSLDDNPGLEHEHATPEGELMTASGSTIDDPHGDDDVTLSDDPGLEHDEATEAGRMMSGSGRSGSEEKDDSR